MDNIYCACTTHNDNDNKMSAHFAHYADEITPRDISTSIKCFSCVCILNCKIGLSLGFHPILSDLSQLSTMLLNMGQKSHLFRVYNVALDWCL